MKKDLRKLIQAQKEFNEDLEEWKVDYSAKNNPARKGDREQKGYMIQPKNPLSYVARGTKMKAYSTTQLGDFMDYHEQKKQERKLQKMSPKQKLRYKSQVI